MAKIAKKEFSRGSALSVSHFKDPIEAAQQLLNAADIERLQLERDHGTFRVDIWSRKIADEFLGPYTVPSIVTQGKPFSVPFMLPPLQDTIQINNPGAPVPPVYTINENTPLPVLTELVFSFDQRAEGAAITSANHNPGAGSYPVTPVAAEGKLDFNNAPDVLNFAISIVEKTPEYFLEQKIGAYAQPEKEVYSYEFPADAFIGSTLQINPIFVTGINRVLNPYKSYVALLHCSGLHSFDFDDSSGYVLANVNISLKFRMIILPRDVDDQPNSEVQNMPIVHRGAVYSSAVTAFNAPAPGASISADDVVGIETNTIGIDERVRRRLGAGYLKDGLSRPKAELAEDGCYEVISASLYANSARGGWSMTERDQYPYYKNTAPTTGMWDSVIIPINYPFVLHHVILAYNWQTWSRGFAAVGAPHPIVNKIAVLNPNYMRLQIGVNIGCGLAGDLLGFQNIASLDIYGPEEGATSNWLSSGLIDRIRVHEEGYSIQNAGLLRRQWDLFQVPIVAGVINGKGFWNQGPPVWCSRSNQTSAWNARTAAQGRTGLNLGVAPVLQGMEQFIEVRVRTFWDAILAGAADDIVVGYGGHKVYLIGKKHLAGERKDYGKWQT